MKIKKDVFPLGNPSCVLLNIGDVLSNPHADYKIRVRDFNKKGEYILLRVFQNGRTEDILEGYSDTLVTKYNWKLV